MSAVAMYAQPATAASAEHSALVELSPFVVSGDKTGRYQSAQATSGGRVRVEVTDSIQSVSVITRELVEDVGANRVLDAAKFVSSVNESTIPNGLDRMSIRGFEVEGQTVDGFRSQSQANLDPVFIDRLEVVKGPNAILSPNGSPGGTINVVTRKPMFARSSGTFSAEVGLFDAQRAELDINEVLGQNKDCAFRLVGAWQDTDGFADDPKKVWAISPMVSVRSQAGAVFVGQFAYTDSHIQSYLGIPIDPSSGTDTTAHLLAGVPRDLNTYDNDFRVEKRPEVRGLLSVPLTDAISMRLAGRYTDFDNSFSSSFQNPGVNTGGAIDPLTGKYTPGLVYSPGPDFAAGPAPAMPRTMNRGGSIESLNVKWANLQDDFVHEFATSWLHATTTGGAAFNYYRQRDQINLTTKPAINYDAPAPASYTVGTLSLRQNTINSSEQAYAAENLSLLQDRVVLNAGYSYNNFDLGVDDIKAAATTRASVDTEMKSYGAVVKPISTLPGLGFYWGYTENANPQTALTIAAGGPALQNGREHEYGARLSLLDKRMLLTVAHFDTTQDNFATPNPGNSAIPQPNPPLPPLLSNRHAHGWEYELHAELGRGISLIANYSAFKNRDPNDIPLRGTAEQSGAAWLRYAFENQSPLHGLSAAVGVYYLGKKPGEAASGFTKATTPTHVIPNQPSFYLPAYTVANFEAAYVINRNWMAQLNIDNVFDKDYMAAGINRYIVVPGAPINARLTIKYTL